MYAFHMLKCVRASSARASKQFRFPKANSAFWRLLITPHIEDPCCCTTAAIFCTLSAAAAVHLLIFSEANRFKLRVYLFSHRKFQVCFGLKQNLACFVHFLAVNKHTFLKANFCKKALKI